MSSIIRGNDNLDSSSWALANACKAWVNFNGTGTVAIRASANVSSITDNGVGDYTVNFTNALADTNYCPITGLAPAISVSLAVGSWHGGVAVDGAGVPLTKTTTALRVRMAAQSGPGTITDMAENYIAVFR